MVIQYMKYWSAVLRFGKTSFPVLDGSLEQLFC